VARWNLGKLIMLNILKRFFGQRPQPVQNALDETAVLRQTRRAFAGELPITRETLHGKEVLTIESELGHKIVVGSSARGKSAAR
jgi:hypothetical protein